MTEFIEKPSGYRTKLNIDLTDFYTIETPPSSSTSKDSLDELSSTSPNRSQFQFNNRSSHSEFFSKINEKSEENNQIFSMYDDGHMPLRRTLGNTKLKTRQDVRRFRKFLKRHYDFQSTNLIEIEPEMMKNYLIHYLTSIRTRKGLKYDPETLRSYFLSIQRFLKDSNYPYCLRNSTHFAQCRDLIIQMRKEKNQMKNSSNSKSKSKLTFDEFEMKTKNSINSSKLNSNDEFFCSGTKQIIVDQQKSSNNLNFSSLTQSKSFLTKDLLPSSSLPLRKRQEMKYFLESKPINDLNYFSFQSVSINSKRPTMILSSDAYSILLQFTHSTLTKSLKDQNLIEQFQQLLDQSSSCGNIQRLMLTSLCHQWTGDIRLIHSNLRRPLNSFLPHILLINILSSNFS